MTTLSLLGGDWEYQFEDETNDAAAVVGTRMLRYVTGVVRTTNEIYSAVAAAADEFTAMGFKNPMLPTTPNEYTLESQAFISRASTEKLKEGTIKANWSLVGAAGNNSGRGVLRVAYSGGVNFIASDIGKRVTQSVTLDTGTLLDFEIEPDGTLVAWIRPEDSTPGTGDLFDGTGTLTVTNGTGASTASVAATSGQMQYTAFQAIGSVPTASEVYVAQDRIKLKDAATNLFQFWDTDTAASLGIISVLIRTQNAGTTISAGDLEVFARRYGALYDNFRLNVAAGGFAALPLASSPDVNNTTGYRRNIMTGSAGTWTVGNALYVGATFATATMKGVITAESAGTIEYYLIGDLTDLTTNSALKEYDFIAAVNGDATATAAIGGSIPNLLGPTDTAAGEGGAVTITLGNTTRDHDNTGVAEPYSVIVDAISAVPVKKVYERVKYATRRGAGNADLFGAGINIPGEQYRGAEATIYYDGLLSGPFTEGDDITGANTWSARAMAVRTTISGEGVSQIYLTVTDQQSSISTVANNDTLSDESASTIVVDTAGAGGGIVSLTSPKSSPLGTFTGSQIFGSPGIDYRNPAAGDAQNYILTDDLGVLRKPPNTVTYNVANTRLGDKVYVARDTGTSGVINKDQFGGMAVNLISIGTVTVTGTVDAEVPTSGYIRVVEKALQQEHKYIYTSRTTGAGGVFTLKGITASTATAGTSTTALIDSTAAFVAQGVESGMLIKVAVGGAVFEVVSVTNATTLVIKQVFGTGGTFVTTNAYTINETIQAYAVTDDIFDLIIDAEELVGTDGAPGSISNTLVKTPAANFGTVAEVRNGKNILPFEQNQTQGDGNTTVTAVRTPDAIAV